MVYNIYTDGSFKDVPVYGGFYSGAAVIMAEGSSTPIATLTKVANDELLPMRNVAGEILATMMAFEHCLSVLHLTQNDTVHLYYDYEGVENWTKSKGEKGYWRAKNKTTQAYRDYVNLIVRPTFKVVFHHVYGHTGNAGNEIVDRAAKNAIDSHIKNLRMEQV